jgi:hypothetical protein
MSCSRIGVPPVSDLNAHLGHSHGSMTVLAACLPRRSGTEAGVLDCARQVKRDAVFLVGQGYSQAVFAIFNFAFLTFHWATVSSLLKVIKGYSRLLKPIFKNPFFIRRSCLVFVSDFRFPTFASLCQLMPSYASLCQLPPGWGVPTSMKPSSITSHSVDHSPSPSGRGQGVRENYTGNNLLTVPILHLFKLKSIDRSVIV